MTAISAEIERFNRLSATWWDSRGPMRPLHVVNTLRLEYVIEQIASHLGRDILNALNGLRVLDMGCGGGLMSEALARRGAHVVGVDASPGNVAAARLHAQSQNITVDHRLGEPAEIFSPQERFDVVLALEVVKHVSDMLVFLSSAAARQAACCLSPLSIERSRALQWPSSEPHTCCEFYRAALTSGQCLYGPKSCVLF